MLIFANFLFFVSDVSESLISLKTNERCERIPHFAHQKWATMSNLLMGHSEEMNDVSESFIALTKNEQKSESLIFLSELLIRSFLTKNEQLARKSNEQIPSPVH